PAPGRAVGAGPTDGLDPSVAREVLHALAGGASPAPWWAASHGRVLARAREFPPSASLEDLEERTCRLVGDEFWDCLQSEHLRYPVGGIRPVGHPLVGCDVYGSRMVLMAPFGYLGAPSHWYAWDIDRCWIHNVVGAGAFASAEDGLREWQGAVGAPAARTTLS